jgi:hypothetical protein
MSEKVNKFLTVVGSVWGKRHESEEASLEWFKSWIFALDKYDAWVLDAAARRIVDERKDDYFPKPAEVHQVCRVILAEDRNQKPRLSETKAGPGDPFALADTLIDCELGRQAARAEPSWILALHDFCRENRRLPAMGEIERCKRVAADFEMKYRLCVQGNAGAFSKPLKQLAETMIKRREALRARLLGREAA